MVIKGEILPLTYKTIGGISPFPYMVLYLAIRYGSWGIKGIHEAAPVVEPQQLAADERRGRLENGP